MGGVVTMKVGLLGFPAKPTEDLSLSVLGISTDGFLVPSSWLSALLPLTSGLT